MSIPMSYAPDATPVAPRLVRAPSGDRSGADEAVELANACGLALLPWQEEALRVMLTEGPDGRWAATEFGFIVPRQNGKTHVLAARILAGLYIFGERLLSYTAHEFKAALELFNVVATACLATAGTRRLIRRIRRSHGEETVELLNGNRFKIFARTKASGRGFAGSTVILDEALELRDDSMIGTLIPTMAAQDNPQLIYASSAGDPGSIVLDAVRKRAHAGNEPKMAWIEYAADPDANSDDPAAWAAGNPSLGTLIREETIEMERRAMPEARFRQERLGIWALDSINAIVPPNVWDDARDPNALEPGAGQPLGLAFDVAPDRSYGSIVASWRRPDGRTHVRVSRYAGGDSWIVNDLRALAENHGTPVAFDDAGPGRDIADALARHGVDVDRVNRRDFAAASAAFLSGLVNRGYTHQGDAPLDAAVAGAGTQRIGDGWTWSRRSGDTDVSPLIAATLAAWALHHVPDAVTPLPRPQVF